MRKGKFTIKKKLKMNLDLNRITKQSYEKGYEQAIQDCTTGIDKKTLALQNDIDYSNRNMIAIFINWFKVERLGRAVRRQKGQKANWNARLKTLCWKIGNQFIKANGGYKKLYDEFKIKYEENHDERCVKFKEFGQYTENNVKGCSRVGHIHNMAIRKTVKIFLSHLWVQWRKCENLPITEPYSIGIMEHSGYIQPIDDSTEKDRLREKL